MDGCARRSCAFFAIASLGVTLTTASPASAYRDLSELPEVEGHSIELWSGGVIPLRIDAASIPGTDFRSIESAVLLGASSWAAPTCTSLTIDYQGPSNS